MEETTPLTPGSGEPDPATTPAKSAAREATAKAADAVRKTAARATRKASDPAEPAAPPAPEGGSAQQAPGNQQAPEKSAPANAAPAKVAPTKAAPAKAAPAKAAKAAPAKKATKKQSGPMVAPGPVAAPRLGQDERGETADIEAQRERARSELAPTKEGTPRESSGSGGSKTSPSEGPRSSESPESVQERQAEFEEQRQEVVAKLRPTLDEKPKTDGPTPSEAKTPTDEDRHIDIEAQGQEAASKLLPTEDSGTQKVADGHLQSGDPEGAVEQKPLAQQIEETVSDSENPTESAPPSDSASQAAPRKKTASQRRSGAWINLPSGSKDAADGGTANAPAADPIPMSMETLGAVGEGAHWNPHSVLGAHVGDGGVTVRTLRPFAQAVSVATGSVDDPQFTPMTHEAHGVWVAVLPGTDVPDYRIQVRYPGGGDALVDDPYRFMPTLGEVDLHLIGEGRHEELWNVLGAHVKRYPGGPMGDVEGVAFAVWAPNARAVRLACDENHWDGRGHQLRSLGSSGVWELFVPGIKAGSRYKFQILGRDGGWREKADPMAQHTEVPPMTASVVCESSYEWSDSAWMDARPQRRYTSEPMSTYEVHLGSWRPGLNYRDLAEELVEYVTSTGFTHVEFMPLAEHPFGGSWGYQVTGYYAPTSRFGHPDDLKHLIDRLHQAGVGVIMDWVPAHFPKDEFALARFDGEPLYEHPDPRRGDHPDWGTHVFDFGRKEVRNFLVANAAYWLEEFHLDGLRVDAVASMLYLDYSREDGQWAPNQYGGREHLEAIDFLQEFNATAYKRVPGIVTIAEESTAWPGVTKPTHVGGLGFGFKWNMGWMHDSLGYVEKEPIYRQYHHHEMTFSMVYAFSENYVLPISHDEVVHGKGSLLRKMPGDRWQQLANLRCYLAFMWGHPGKKLLFMGQEFGQEAEWNESRGLDWWLLDQPLHQGALDLMSDLNALYKAERPLYEIDTDSKGFEWIDGNDSLRNLFSFVRKDLDGNEIVVVCNFAGHPYEDFRLALPRGGEWEEVLNTDDTKYGGSGVVNTGALQAEDVPWTGRDHSVQLRVPPLGATFLKRRG